LKGAGFAASQISAHDKLTPLRWRCPQWCLWGLLEVGNQTPHPLPTPQRVRHPQPLVRSQKQIPLRMVHRREVAPLNLNFRVPHTSFCEGCGFCGLSNHLRRQAKFGSRPPRRHPSEIFNGKESTPAPFANTAKSAAPATSTAKSKTNSTQNGPPTGDRAFEYEFSGAALFAF